MGVVTWFTALTNQMHSARSVPHFTFRIPQFRILPVRNVLGRSHMSSYIHLQINIIIPSFAFFLRAKVPPIFSRNDSSFFSFFDVDGVEAIFLICVITEKYRKVSNATNENYWSEHHNTVTMVNTKSRTYCFVQLCSSPVLGCLPQLQIVTQGKTTKNLS